MLAQRWLHRPNRKRLLVGNEVTVSCIRSCSTCRRLACSATRLDLTGTLYLIEKVTLGAPAAATFPLKPKQGLNGPPGIGQEHQDSWYPTSREKRARCGAPRLRLPVRITGSVAIDRALGIMIRDRYPGPSGLGYRLAAGPPGLDEFLNPIQD